MTETLLDLLGYGCVLIFGLFLSVYISGGWQNSRQKWSIILLCPVFLLVQAAISFFGGIQVAERVYPLAVHLPLVLILVFTLKKPFGIAIVSVCTAYLCCQLPNWISLCVSGITESALLSEIAYLVCIGPIFFLLHRFFCKPAYMVMTYSRQALLLFGSLPFVYYLFDYTTGVYGEYLNIQYALLFDFLPTSLILFYVVFLAAYHQLSQKRAQAELQHSMLEAELHQSEIEIYNLRATQTQAAVYRHDFRHHMNIINGFLAVENIAQARQYIQKVYEDMDAFLPQRFCQNETVNLLCSSFFERAASMGITLIISATLPAELELPDTEICSVISNGLENALCAVSHPEVKEKKVDFYCNYKQDKLLLEITNAYAGQVIMEDGVPVSQNPGHGYGCSSILSITRKRHGLCSFKPENGIFTLQVVLPCTKK